MVGNKMYTARPLHRALAAVASVSLVTGAEAQCQPASIAGLGLLPNSVGAHAGGISADGTTVVGHCFSPDQSFSWSFRWTAAMGLQDLGTLPGGGASTALATNADGSVVVGGSVTGPGGSYRAYRWTVSAGMHDLGGLLATNPSLAYAVSADGSVVVGGLVAGPFRWTLSSGASGLTLPPTCPAGQATGVSADGSVVVGTAYRWTVADGAACVEPVMHASVVAVSADGLVPVGRTTQGNESAPVRWHPDGQMRVLGPFQSTSGGSSAFNANADGSVIVGFVGQRAFLWTAAYGMLDLEGLLGLFGADISRWSLEYARGVSADGAVIAGTGWHQPAAGGPPRREAFRATIPLLLTRQPAATLACIGGTRSIGVSAAGTAAPFTFTWRRDGAPLAEGDARIEIVVAPDGRSSTLTFHGIRGTDAGTYDCIVASEACPVQALFTTDVGICPADYNCDGVVNSSDISAFITAWLSSVQDGATDADFSGDDVTNSSDISAFITAWLAAVQNGC